jgi:O-antigen/teichoic acid export membrane protein
MRRSVHRASLLFAALLLPVVIILTLGGDRIVMGVYGKSYSGNAVVLFLLALNMLINSSTNTYSQGLFSLKSAKADTLVNLVWVVLLFTIGIVAIRTYAALGAAVTLLVSGVLTSVIRIAVFVRRVRQPE